MPEVRPWVYPYAQIAEHYRALIRDHTLNPGDQLPSIEKIAAEWKVAIATVQRAIKQLRSEGWVRSEWGTGTFVVDKPPP